MSNSSELDVLLSQVAEPETRVWLTFFGHKFDRIETSLSEIKGKPALQLGNRQVNYLQDMLSASDMKAAAQAQTDTDTESDKHQRWWDVAKGAILVGLGMLGGVLSNVMFHASSIPAHHP